MGFGSRNKSPVLLTQVVFTMAPSMFQKPSDYLEDQNQKNRSAFFYN
jgi:hypothetical protein